MSDEMKDREDRVARELNRVMGSEVANSLRVFRNAPNLAKHKSKKPCPTTPRCYNVGKSEVSMQRRSC